MSHMAAHSVPGIVWIVVTAAAMLALTTARPGMSGALGNLVHNGLYLT